MVDEIIKAFKEHNSKMTVMKIWSKGNLHIVLAVFNPDEWNWEMDPYYIYDNGRIDGIFLAQATELFDTVINDKCLIYKNPKIGGNDK